MNKIKMYTYVKILRRSNISSSFPLFGRSYTLVDSWTKVIAPARNLSLET
jgi:hypothetical protein